MQESEDKTSDSVSSDLSPDNIRALSVVTTEKDFEKTSETETDKLNERDVPESGFSFDDASCNIETTKQEVQEEKKNNPQVFVGRDITISDEAVRILTEPIIKEEKKVEEEEKADENIPQVVQWSTKIDGKAFRFAAFFSYVCAPISCVANVILGIVLLFLHYDILIFVAWALVCFLAALIMFVCASGLKYFKKFAFDMLIVYLAFTIFLNLMVVVCNRNEYSSFITAVILIFSLIYFLRRREYYTR